jgi:hypothetical protein
MLDKARAKLPSAATAGSGSSPTMANVTFICSWAFVQ